MSLSVGALVVGWCAVGLGAAAAPPAMYFEAELIPAGSEVTDIVQADFNGDGRDDLVVVRRDGFAQIIELLEQSSAGEFNATWQWRIAPGFEPARVDVMDFDHVGGPDLVVSVAPPSLQPVDGEGVFVFANAAGLFDRDDSTVTNQVAPTDSNASIFEPAVCISRDGPQEIVIADVNGDGIDDVVAASGRSEVLAYVFDGEGAARPIVIGPSGLPRYDKLQFGDVDGDGDQDIVLLRESSPSSSGALLLNNGFPHDVVPLEFEPLLTPGQLRDWTGDGIVDVLGFSSGGFTVMAGDGAGGFTEGQSMWAPRLTVERVLDIDRDGHMDLVGRTFSGTSGMVSILYGDEGGAFTDPIFWWPGQGKGGGLAALAQANGGHSLMIGAAEGFAALRWRGARQYAAAQVLYPRSNSSFHRFIAIGDVTGDGHRELVAAVITPHVDVDRVEVWRRAGGVFTFSTSFSYETLHDGVTFPVAPQLVDADDDGDLDLAMSATSMTNNLNDSFLQIDLIENVDGTLVATTARNLYRTCTAVYVPLTLQDLNHDGRLDLAIADPATPNSLCSGPDALNRLVIVPGDGAAFQSDPIETPVGDQPTGFFRIISYIGDLNADGYDDVVVEWPDSQTMSSHSPEPALLPGTNQGYGPASTLDQVAMRYPRIFVDVNDDGFVDVIGRPEESVIRGTLFTGDQIAVQYGLGSGALETPRLLMQLRGFQDIARLTEISLTASGDSALLAIGQTNVGVEARVLPLAASSLDNAALTSVRLPSSSYVGPVESQDLDGDGDHELIFPLGSRIVVFDSAVADTPRFDLDANGVVNGADLAMLLQSWGHRESPCDLNGDAIVDRQDFVLLLAHWSP